MPNPERARDDARMSNEFGRSGAQVCVLINGGAATAILANSHAPAAIMGHTLQSLFVPCALAFYAIGVFLGSMAFVHASKALANWMLYHQGDQREKTGVLGDRYWDRAINFVTGGLICFVVSSLTLAGGLFFQAL